MYAAYPEHPRRTAPHLVSQAIAFNEKMFNFVSPLQNGRVFLLDASSGLRCPNCGGNADNGDNDGVGYVNVNNAFSDANANVSSPHYLSSWYCLQPSEKIMEEIRAPVAKNQAPLRVLVGRKGRFESSGNDKADSPITSGYTQL